MAHNDPSFPLGAAVRTDGWPMFNRGLYTLSVHLQSFIGAVVIEAALTTAPADADWFEIYRVTGYNVTPGPKVEGTTLTGRYTWMRVRTISTMGFLHGCVDKVLLR